MKLVDTHCHVHDSEFYKAQCVDVYERSAADGVYMLTVGTSEESSRQAVAFVQGREMISAIVGVHPHDTKLGWAAIDGLARQPGVVGIGEIGLDYFYLNSPRETQMAGLEAQLQIAVDHNLPISFHVRDEKSSSGAVWRDFWPIFDNFHGIRGVLHSFTDTQAQLDKGFECGLYVGINGIATFTRDDAQRAMYARAPLEKIMLETDAPFLTPAPLRGKMNKPKYVGMVADWLAAQKNLSREEVCGATTRNARALYQI